jgi:hypothetical protein
MHLRGAFEITSYDFSCELYWTENVDTCLPASFKTALGRGFGFEPGSRNESLIPRKVRKITANKAIEVERGRGKIIVGKLSFYLISINYNYLVLYNSQVTEHQLTVAI